MYGPAGEEFRAAAESLLDGQLPPGWEWVKRTPRSVVARRPEPYSAYFKEFVPRSPLENLKAFLRGSRCQRAVERGDYLAQKGFRCPQVLCWGRRGGRNFMVTRGVQAIGLGHLAASQWHAPWSRARLRAKWRLLAELGTEIGRLHRAGICHGDLLPNNVLAQHADGQIVFYFVDNERNSHFRRLPLRLVEKNLIQLQMIDGQVVTRTDRLRFFRAYCAAYPRFAAREARHFVRGLHQKALARWRQRQRGQGPGPGSLGGCGAGGVGAV